MTPRRESGDTAVRDWWAGAIGQVTNPEQVGLAVDRRFARLRTELGRWIGSDAYRLLLARACAQASAEHDALAGLTCLGEDGPLVVAAVRTHGLPQVTGGIAMVVTVLSSQLGRIIGEEIALRLVAQVGTPSPRGVAGTRVEGDRHG